MTISYTAEISKTTSLSFLKVLLRWKGSAWKNCWKEYMIWVSAYFLIYTIVRHEHISPELQIVLANLVHHLDDKLTYIPLVLLLGFFVTFVIDRWKQIFANIAFIDNLAFIVSNYITGSEEEAITARKNILRYACAAQALLLRDISCKVRKRFPTMESLVQSGLLQEHEVRIIEREISGTEKYVIPINWACGLVVKIKKAGKIMSDTLVNGIFKEINEFHKQLQKLCNYDYVPVPLAYPQVAFCVVRSYLAICLVARQYVAGNSENPKSTADIETLVISLMTLIQVFFYLAWIKVAEELLNPLGDDDNDFECNFVLDYNITLAVATAETADGLIPEQRKDNFRKPPRTSKGYLGSVSKLNFKTEADDTVKMIPHRNALNSFQNDEFPGKVRMERRMTFPLSFRRRNEKSKSNIPGEDLARQMTVQTINAEDLYKTFPSGTSHEESTFSETYSFHPHSPSRGSEDGPSLPFAKSGRFDKNRIVVKE